MEGWELKDGKARVRKHLIEPLVERGMERKRSWTVDRLNAFFEGLEARLSYMTAENLNALAEAVVTHADGPKKNVWPADATICNFARRLQIPPASESRLVRTYLQSVQGDAAKSGGYLVELRDFLKKHGAPPNSYALSMIRADAEENRRRRSLVEDRIRRGSAMSSDVQWLEEYRGRQRAALDIIKAKQGVEA